MILYAKLFVPQCWETNTDWPAWAWSAFCPWRIETHFLRHRSESLPPDCFTCRLSCMHQHSATLAVDSPDRLLVATELSCVAILSTSHSSSAISIHLYRPTTVFSASRPRDLSPSNVYCDMMFSLVPFVLFTCPNHLGFLFLMISSSVSYFPASRWWPLWKWTDFNIRPARQFMFTHWRQCAALQAAQCWKGPCS